MNQKQRYNQIWGCGDVQSPEIWSVWEIIKDFQGTTNLEIGPGNYPKIPVKNGYFLDISESAIKNLKKAGGKALVGDVTNLSFEDKFFDLVVAIHILEHIENDKKAFSEIARVLKPSGFFLFAVPTRKELFNEIDEIVGHKRRYDVGELKALLSNTGFKILKYRYPSFYLDKLISKGASFFHLPKKALKSKRLVEFLHSPRFLINFCTKIWAFLEKKGAPQWQTDIKNLSAYKDRAIVLFCQKK